jgi:DNA/RNA endonuclease YhcR with UshA esterase domain
MTIPTLGADIKTDIQKVEADAKKLFTFGISHIVLFTMLALAIFGGIYLYDSKRADAADARATLSDYKAQQAVATNSTYQTQVQTQIAALTEQNSQLAAEVSVLSRASQVRTQTLVVTQKSDATLAPSALSQKWNALLKDANASTPTVTGYVVSNQGAVETVQALDSIPVLTSNLADANSTITTQQTEIANDALALTMEQSAHTADNLTAKTQLAASALDLKACKADARKGKLKWFGIGFVVGFISAHFAGF